MKILQAVIFQHVCDFNSHALRLRIDGKYSATTPRGI